MARTERTIPASPEQVWAVVGDPRTYGDWVVGAHEVRAVEPEWPEPGATFHHTQGRPPLSVEDTTTAIDAQPPRHLAMEVRIRPWSVGVVEFELHDHPAGTHVVMHERMLGGVVGRLSAGGRLVDPLVHLRNLETLRRLHRVVEARAAATGGVTAAPPRPPGSRERATR